MAHQKKKKELLEQQEAPVIASKGVPARAARIAWVGLALAVIIAAAVLLSATGRATVAVTLAVDEHEQPMMVRVEPANTARTPGQADVVFVAGDVVESTGSGKASKTIHSTQVIPGYSHGLVTLINTSSRAQPLVSSTRLLSSDGVLFRISKSVVVPARGRVRVEARADSMGTDGDVPATHWKIPGLSNSLQRLIFGETQSPMTGGVTEVRRVDKVDIAEVVAKAEVDADRTAQNSITVAPTLFRFSRPTSSVRTLNAKEGGNVAELTADVRAVVTHVLIDPRAANVAVRAAIETAERIKGNDVVDIQGDVTTFALGKIFRAEGVAELSGSVKVRTRRKSDGLSSQLQTMLAGLSIEDATARVRARDGVQLANITPSPPWLWTMPGRSDHIMVLLK